MKKKMVLPFAGPVARLAWHPTDDLLALATMDKQVLIWSAADETVTSSTSTSEWLSSLAWSPDGTELALGGIDEAISIWNPTSGVSRPLTGHATQDYGEIQLDWSSTGMLATLGSDTVVRIWDLNTDSITHEFDGYAESTEIAWSPDGSLLAWMPNLDVTLVWDSEADDIIASFERDDFRPSSLAWSPDGERIAVFGGELVMWDPGADTQTAILDGISSRVSVAWSPDGALIAVAGFESAVLDLDAGSIIQMLPEFTGEGHDTIGWSADGTKLALAGMSPPYVWNRGGRSSTQSNPSGKKNEENTTEPATLLPGYINGVTAMSMTADGERVVFADGDRMIWTWTPRSSPNDDTPVSDTVNAAPWAPNDSDYETWLESRDRNNSQFSASQYNANLLWSPDGTWFAAADTSIVRLWDPDKLATSASLPLSNLALAWSPDSTRLAMAASGSTIRIWTPATDEMREVVTDHPGAVTSLAWAPDGERLASGGAQGLIRVWPVTESRGRGLSRLLRKPDVVPTLALETDGSSIKMVTWSPDGAKLATVGQGPTKRVRVSDAITGKEIESPDWGFCFSVGWLSGGVELGGVSDSGKTVVWNLEDNTTTEAHFTGHGGPVRNASWSGVGHRIATSGMDGTVQVWDPTTAQTIDRFPRPR